MPRPCEQKRWKEVHNRKPGEKKDAMAFLELRSADEVAKILGITRQRVQQIEREALHKIRRALRQTYEEHFYGR